MENFELLPSVVREVLNVCERLTINVTVIRQFL